jgi:hypothetical protein
MVKLIYRYSWNIEDYTCTEVYPFEYKGKDEFVYDINKRFDKKHFKQDDLAKIFGQWLNEKEIREIKNNIFTLEEWFDKEKMVTFAL